MTLSTCICYVQAMECRIAGVVPLAGNWSGECCIAVRQLLAGKTVPVRLVETQQNGRIHAVDILLSMGMLYGVGKTEKHDLFQISVIFARDAQVKDLHKCKFKVSNTLPLSFRKALEHVPP